MRFPVGGERRKRALLIGMAALATLCVAPPAPASNPALTCQSNKNKEAGKYADCRQKAEAKFALNGDDVARTVAFQKCIDKFTLKWPSIEAKAAGAGKPCPSVADQAEVQSGADTYTGNLALILAGGTPSDCATDLSTCQGNLSTCASDLDTCETDSAGCTSTLATAQANLSTCTSNLTTCTSNAAACNGSLTTAQASLATCTTNLGTCTSSLGSAQTSLSTCTTNLGTCNGSLATCQGDLTTCQAVPRGQPLKTGETTCFDAAGATIACAGSGQDGESQRGIARAYTDNGDGTITDAKTGLTWEKLSDDGGIHDKDTVYTWTDALAHIGALNGANFAGHNDWRLPNLNELQTLANYGAVSPAVAPAFNTGCVAACTVTGCSCTQAGFYWSSTTYLGNPQAAWTVTFGGGGVNALFKTNTFFARAVRPGS
jgi:uncharacterized protein DUF1566